MLTVSGLARRSGATVHAVRYYTRRGLLQPLQDPGNGYHFYLPRDVRRLRFIRQAKELGYTLNDIGEILGEADHGQSPCPRVREILQEHVVETRRRLESLVALQERMELALREWSEKADGVPDGHSVCHLIEAIETD